MRVINTLNRLSNGYDRLKTVLFYRPLFQSIGAGTTLKRPLLLANTQFISLGNRVFIRDGVRLEVIEPQAGITPVLTIGDGTNLEQNVHIVCRNRIQIGPNVSVTGNCVIVDVTHPYEDIHDPRKIGERILEEPSYVEIGEGSMIGMGSVILPNVRIGKYVVVGANSVVSSDLPDYCVAAGAPARVIRKYDTTTQAWLKAVSESRENRGQENG